MITTQRLVAFLALLVIAQHAFAVAFCALRDPVNTIYALFPEANGYRSSVETVGRPAREAVVRHLPVTLHFNELGRHTLYIALKDGDPIGFVHARSETGEWGITEYAWAISPDKTIRDVLIQRSRDPSIRKTSVASIVKIVQGKSLDTLQNSYPTAQAKGQTMAASVMIAAMKALVITEAVWPHEFKAFEIGAGKHPISLLKNAEPIPQLYDQSAVVDLNSLGLEESPAFQRNLLRAYRVTDPQQNRSLLLVRTPFDLGEKKGTLWWTLDADGEVISIINEATRQPDERFASVIGYAPLSMQDCSNLADLAALELAVLSRRHSNG